MTKHLETDSDDILPATNAAAAAAVAAAFHNIPDAAHAADNCTSSRI
jgi:hypothetical protein